MKIVDVLTDIKDSFDTFQDDFYERESYGININFAMDNDVFSFALFPKEMKNYADLFGELDSGSSNFLEQKARRLAYSIRYLAERESLYILPAHETEYKKTIYYFFIKLDELKNKIDKDKLEKERIELKNNFKEISKFYQKDSSIFMSKVKEFAPILFELLNKKSDYAFAANQLHSLTIASSKMKHFSDISDKDIDYCKYADCGDINIGNIIQEKSTYEKNKISLQNDIDAVKTVLGYNTYHAKEKKLVLITGDKGINSFYKKITEDNDIEYIHGGIVRYPKYFTPFISEVKINLYENHNKQMIEKIDSLFDSFFEMYAKKINGNNHVMILIDESKKLIENLKEILSIKYIKSVSRSRDIKEKEEDASREVLKFMHDKNFIKDIGDFYENSVYKFRSALVLIPTIDIIIDARKELRDLKYFHRYPFILCLKENKEQEQFANFMKIIIEKKRIDRSIFDIKENFPLYTVQLIAVVIMLYVERFDLVDIYLKEAEKEISKIKNVKHDTYLYMISELNLLKLFTERKRLYSMEGYEELKKNFENYDRKNANDGQKIRVDVGECSLEVFYIYYQYFNNEHDDLQDKCNEVYSKLSKIAQDIDNIYLNRPKVKERAEIQIYLNLASIYLIKKYFFKIESLDNKIILNNLNIYYKLYSQKDISVRQTILSVLFWDLEENESKKESKRIKSIDVIRDIMLTSNNLKDYEVQRANKFLNILSLV